MPGSRIPKAAGMLLEKVSADGSEVVAEEIAVPNPLYDEPAVGTRTHQPDFTRAYHLSTITPNRLKSAPPRAAAPAF